jgi:hypothetical protein
MGLNYILILLVPTIVLMVSFFLFKNKYTLKEVFIQFGSQALICLIILLITFNWNLMDSEIWNGQAIGKKSERVHCRHSYTCNCRTISCGKDCETIVCDTCYEHSYDIDWNIYTNIDITFRIETIDRQGLKEPPRWTQVNIGDPVCDKKMYVNYIKSNPDNLQIQKGMAKKYKNKLFDYPNKIYDYYHLNRILNIAQCNKIDINVWNNELEKILSVLGPVKKCNVILIFVRNEPTEYYYALQEHWINGKKNDIIILTSIDNNDIIQWCKVMTLTQYDSVRTKIRDDFMAMGEINKDKIFKSINDNISCCYKHKDIKDYKYMSENRALSTGQLIFLFISSLILSIGLSIYFVKNDIRD